MRLENIKDNNTKRVDDFWNQIFNIEINGLKKYPTLKKVIQAILTLSHGSADVERGFSLSARILTKERNSLEEKTLNSILVVSDAINKVYNNKVENILITPELHSLARNAHSAYELYLEEQKKKRELEDQAKLEKHKQQEIEEMERRVKEKETQTLKELENNL